ncbi:MAG: hypothetical protein SWJ54_13770 [Cyanobacteriota bacterium]|nr:hypothetical protein [Cyanobacteriota bacterium]
MEIKDLAFQRKSAQSEAILGGFRFFAKAKADAFGNRLSFAQTKTISFGFSGKFGK